MRKLNRKPFQQLPVTVQTTLSNATANGLRWDDIGKDGVRQELRVMQHGHCAYCGCKLSDADDLTRIDHFIPRSSASGKSRVFDWTNLYLSCDRPNTCDSFKGSKTDAIVNPDTEDPADFLTYGATGAIMVRRGLSAPDATKAAATIRVLNLAAGELAAARIVYFNRMVKNLGGVANMKAYLARRDVQYYSFCVSMLTR